MRVRAGQDVLTPGPARGLVQQRVLVEIGVVGQLLRRGLGAEQRPDGGSEDLAQVEVDRPNRPVEVDLLVQQQARR